MSVAESRRRAAAPTAGGLALASVTALLKHFLENGLAERGVTAQLGGDVSVSALPLDRITSGPDEKAQLNLFLYLVTPHTMLRLGDQGARRAATLAVDLHYLVTAFGAQDLQSEVLLGHAIEILHERAVVDAATAARTLGELSSSADRRVLPPALAALGGATLAEQMESQGHLSITPLFLTTEEVSKLWSAMQAKYRPSAAYKVSAVPLIAAPR